MTLIAVKMATSKQLSLLLFCGVFVFVFGNVQEGYEQKSVFVDQTQGQPWPLPQKISQSSEQFAIDPATFKFQNTGQVCTTLSSGFDRYITIMFGNEENRLTWRPRQVMDQAYVLHVNVKTPCTTSGGQEMYPQLESDESCKDK